MVLILTARARRVMLDARRESAVLKRSLSTAEAIFRAEPQVLIFWDQTEGLRIVTHTLTTIEGLPQDQPTLLKFGIWARRCISFGPERGT